MFSDDLIMHFNGSWAFIMILIGILSCDFERDTQVKGAKYVIGIIYFD